MRTLTLPACPAVTKEIGRTSKDHWSLFDTPSELADYAQANCAAAMRKGGAFYGGDSGGLAAQKTRQGDPSRVAKSDELLARFERFAFETERRRWRDDVCGSFPIVPAFLAGNPLAMRRRIVDRDAGAPLAIVVDLTTSGDVDARTIERRGAAILALTRLLTMRRPVELWAGVMTGAKADRELAAIFTRLDTQPLDLARAAYVMTSAAFPRALCYSIAKTKHGFEKHWPYSSHTASRTHIASIVAQAFPHMTATLCIPAVHSDDDIARNPEKWIEQKLTELAPTLEAA